jgi:hypothetical protein
MEDDPLYVARSIGSIMEGLQIRDQRMKRLETMLEPYTDALVLGPGGDTAVALAKSAGGDDDEEIDVFTWDCTNTTCGCTNPTPEMLERLSFRNGVLVAVNAEIGTGTDQRPVASKRYDKYVQDCEAACCCWCDPVCPPTQS